MTTEKWDDLKARTAEALSDVLRMDSEPIADDVDELAAIAGRMVDHWRRLIEGKAKDTDLCTWMIRHYRSQAQLLVDIHHRDAHRNLVAKVQRNLIAMTDAGLALLRAGFNGTQAKS